MLGTVLFLLSITNTFAGKCTLNFKDNRPGIFWTSFGGRHILLEVINGRVEWVDQMEITGYCPDFFTRSDDFPAYSSSVLFSCSGGTVKYRMSKMVGSNFSVLRNEEISCRRTAQYFEATIPMCSDYGLAYGFFVEGTPVVLAAVCYNLKSMKPRFLHNIVGLQSSMVELQEDQNLVNSDAQRVAINCINIEDEYEREILADVVTETLPIYHSRQFELGDLISIQGSQNFPDAYFDDLNCVNKISWWKPLKYGNWKTVEEIVDNLARRDAYDVYTGTSGVMTYKNVWQYIRKVPFYVWKYIKGRNNDTAYDVVIVGINFPYAQDSHPSENICSDMCDELSWMDQSLLKTRQFVVLGYVFCCRPNDVKTKLDNLPEFAINHPN